MQTPEQPKRKKSVEIPQPGEDVVLPQISDVASAGECTGLIPAAPGDQAQQESLQSLHSNALPQQEG